MLINEPYSPNKNLIDAIDAQLESIRKLLSVLRDNMSTSVVVDPIVDPVDPSMIKYYTTTSKEITCNAEPK